MSTGASSYTLPEMVASPAPAATLAFLSSNPLRGLDSPAPTRLRETVLTDVSLNSPTNNRASADFDAFAHTPTPPFGLSSSTLFLDTLSETTANFGWNIGGQGNEQLVNDALSQASHQRLVQARNPAYVRLCEEYNRLKREFETVHANQRANAELMQTITQLNSVIDKLKSATDNPLLPNTLLETCKTIELEPKNPNVKYWMADAWRAAQREHGKTNTTGKSGADKPRFFHFCEDADGQHLPDGTQALVKTHARGLYAHMMLHPDTFGPPIERMGDLSHVPWEFLKAEMYKAFPWFKLCEGDWKLRAFVTEHYPTWWKNHSPSAKAKKQVKREGTDDLSDIDAITAPTPADLPQDQTIAATSETTGSVRKRNPTTATPVTTAKKVKLNNPTEHVVFAPSMQPAHAAVIASTDTITNSLSGNSTVNAAAETAMPQEHHAGTSAATLSVPEDTPTPALPSNSPSLPLHPSPTTMGVDVDKGVTIPSSEQLSMDKLGAMNSPSLATAKSTGVEDFASGQTEHPSVNAVFESQANSTNKAAAVNTPITGRTLCHRDWLKTNPEGSEAEFTMYWKAASKDASFKKAYEKAARQEKSLINKLAKLQAGQTRG